MASFFLHRNSLSLSFNKSPIIQEHVAFALENVHLLNYNLSHLYEDDSIAGRTYIRKELRRYRFIEKFATANIYR